MARTPAAFRFLATAACSLVIAVGARAQEFEPPLEIESAAGSSSAPSAPSRDASPPAAVASTAIPGPPTPSLAARFQAQGDALRDSGSSSCVDSYYRAAVVAYACLEAAPPDARDTRFIQALNLYNINLTECLNAAASFGRVRPSSQLTIRYGGSDLRVPVAHNGFVWQSSDFSTLIDPARVPPDKKLERRHVRAGLGARIVSMRYAPRDHPRDFLPSVATFPATAVLEPDLDVWFGHAEGPPHDRLSFLDPFRVSSVVVGGRTYSISADLDSGLTVMQSIVHPDQLRVDGFLDPASWREKAGIYFLEPFQPGKIPVVLVHGLASTPWTWSDMIGMLRSDPALHDRFQIWVFLYPTGNGFFQSARILRDSLQSTIDTFDPDGRDPALQQMVLIGHSMGGLLSRIMISSSDGAIWSTYSGIPLENTVLSDRARDWVDSTLVFEPQPHVRRVIFVATPHRGSHVADALLGRFASSLVREPAEVQVLYNEVRASNPGAFRRSARRLPTSVDLLRRDNPVLNAVLHLPMAPGVPYHTVAGVGKPALDGEASDGVVPLSSARLAGASSELLVPATHGTVQHHPDTIDEVRDHLEAHLESFSPTPGLARLPSSRRPGRLTPRPAATRPPETEGDLPQPP